MDWSCLFSTLYNFNFGPTLCDWVETFYNNIASSIKNGGMSSGYLNLGTGVRQDDPLSANIFIIVIELLATAIRTDEKTLGKPIV